MPDQALNLTDKELHDELRRRQEEILRLRDLLIAKDAELGAALGRSLELEQSTVRLMTAIQKVRGIVWIVAAKLRGRRS